MENCNETDKWTFSKGPKIDSIWSADSAFDSLSTNCFFVYKLCHDSPNFVSCKQINPICTIAYCSKLLSSTKVFQFTTIFHFISFTLTFQSYVSKVYPLCHYHQLSHLHTHTMIIEYGANFNMKYIYYDYHLYPEPMLAGANRAALILLIFLLSSQKCVFYFNF